MDFDNYIVTTYLTVELKTSDKHLLGRTQRSGGSRLNSAFNYPLGGDQL